jgi:hypothetical protein
MRSAKSGSWLRSSRPPAAKLLLLALLPAWLCSTVLTRPLLLLLLLLVVLLLLFVAAAGCWCRCQKRVSSWSSNTDQSICTGMSAATAAAAADIQDE